MKNYYEILGISKDADQKSIKEAFRKLALKYHPDRNQNNPRAIEKMKEINEAYAVLSDPEKRRRYDIAVECYGDRAYEHFKKDYSDEEIFKGSDIFQFFDEIARALNLRDMNEIFRDFHTVNRTGRGFFYVYQGTGRGKFPFIFFIPILRFILRNIFPQGSEWANVDRFGTIVIDEADAERGGKVSYYDRKLDKQFIVRIPPGVKDGQTIRLKGAIGDGFFFPRRDLYLKVRIRKPFLKRIGSFVKKFVSPKSFK